MPDDLGTVRKRVLVTGRVQGVFFRSSCKREADLRAVRGWVRNTSDGAVEAEFEGNKGAVAAMIGWCRSGPQGARVENVETAAVPLAGETSFRVC